MKHFKLTDEVLDLGSVKLRRIEALIDLPKHGIKKGDKGGWIEREAQVSGNAWVSDNAQVYGDAQVSGDAHVYGDAQVYGNAWVSGDAQVYGNAQVYGDARVSNNAQVSGDAHIDCAGAILCIAIGGFYTITLTRKWLFAGCQSIERKKWLRITKKQAVEMGCKPELYAPLNEMVKAGMKIVKEKP